MVNEELYSYFEKNIKKGHSIESLKKNCLKHGHSKNEVNKIAGRFQFYQDERSRKRKKILSVLFTSMLIPLTVFLSLIIIINLIRFVGLESSIAILYFFRFLTSIVFFTLSFYLMALEGRTGNYYSIGYFSLKVIVCLFKNLYPDHHLFTLMLKAYRIILVFSILLNFSVVMAYQSFI